MLIVIEKSGSERLAVKPEVPLYIDQDRSEIDRLIAPISLINQFIGYVAPASSKTLEDDNREIETGTSMISRRH